MRLTGSVVEPLGIYALDITPPLVPTGLTAVFKGARVVDLSWNADPDAAVVEIYRNGMLIGSRSTTSYRDSVGSGTYVYTLKAIDLAGNHSDFSDEATVVIPSPGSNSLGRFPIGDVSLGRASDDEEDQIRDFGP